MSIKDDLAALEAQISQAQRAEALAEAEREAAVTRWDTAKAQLFEEFGVDSVAQAQKLAKTYEAELQEALTRAQKSLEESS